MEAAAARRLVLVCLSAASEGAPLTPLGHASLASALRARTNVEVTERVHRIGSACDEEIAARVASEMLSDCKGNPMGTDVGFGVYIWNDRVVQRAMALLREAGFRGKIILGGPSVSFLRPDLWISYPHADCVFQGYAEDALCEFYRPGSAGDVPGLVLPGQARPARPAQLDVAPLPSPWLDQSRDPLVGPDGYVHWESKRGCKNRCSFCQHHEGGTRLVTREFDMSRVRAEIELLVSKGVRRVSVLDPTFNMPGTRYEAVLDAWRASGFKGELSLQCRFDGIDTGFLDACEGLTVVPEFGLQSTEPSVQRHINRWDDLGSVQRACELLVGTGIQFHVTLIYGLPGQTLDSFRSDVDFCRSLRVPRIRAFPLQIYPGTRMEARAGEWGLVRGDDRYGTVVRTGHMDQADMKAAHDIAEALQNKPGSPSRTEGARSRP